jgi:hypothetical protein
VPEDAVSTELEKAALHRKIEARRAQANLLWAAARHVSVKAEIKRAERDLDEAGVWLKGNRQVCPQSALELVDGMLIAAGRRLDLIRTLLTTRGPDVALTSD